MMRNRNCLNVVAGILALTVLSSARPAHASAEQCTRSGLCVNDYTYVKINGRIDQGPVDSFDELNQTVQIHHFVNGSMTVVKVSLKDAAVIKPEACLDSAKSLCNGEPYYFRDGMGKMQQRVLSGYFPTTQELVDLKPNGDPILRAASSVMTASQPSPVHSFADIIQRVKSGTPLFLNDFVASLKISDDELEANAWSACKNIAFHGFPLQVDQNDFLLEKCQPDTLYSWGSAQKIKKLAMQIGEGPWRSNPFDKEALYTTESPISSFGYGSKNGKGGYAIRLKLKKGVQFGVFEDGSMPSCSFFPAAQNKNTVYVRVVPMGPEAGLEFDLCSAEPIESWSYGTPEFYRELTLDLARVLSPKYADDFLSYFRSKDDNEVYHPELWTAEPDEQPFNKAALINEYKDLALMVQKQRGMIFYNPDVSANDESKRARHFSSANDMWFHH